jgi:hypothetical protein
LFQNSTYSCLEKCLINRVLSLTISVRRMWGKKTKNKAVDVWHTKAMLVDPKKTKITILWNIASEKCETEENSVSGPLNIKTEDPKIMAPNMHHAEDLEVVDPNFECAEHNFKTMESNLDETADFDQTTLNVETLKLNSGTKEPEAIEAQKATLSEGSVKNPLKNLGDMESNFEAEDLDNYEILTADVTLENLEITNPSGQSMAFNVAEVQNPLQSKEKGKMEQTLETVELNQPTVSSATASSKNSTDAESTEIEAVNTCEIDSNFSLTPVDKETEKAMFLGVLEKTRSKWYNDKQFAKIVQKMEKGKRLKGKDFEKVYVHIRDYCQSA